MLTRSVSPRPAAHRRDDRSRGRGQGIEATVPRGQGPGHPSFPGAKATLQPVVFRGMIVGPLLASCRFGLIPAPRPDGSGAGHFSRSRIRLANVPHERRGSLHGHEACLLEPIHSSRSLLYSIINHFDCRRLSYVR